MNVGLSPFERLDGMVLRGEGLVFGEESYFPFWE